MRLVPQPVRWRLTLWYALVLGVLLLTFAAGAFTVMKGVLITRSDLFLSEAGDSFAGELAAEAHEANTLAAAVSAAQRDVHFGSIDFLLYDPRQRTFAAGTSPVPAGNPEAPPPYDLAALRALIEAQAPLTNSRAARLSTLPGPEGGYRAALRRVNVFGEEHVLVTVQSRLFLHETLETLLVAFAVAAPIFLLLSCLPGYLLARRALAPLSEMSRRTRDITAARLHDRLPVSNPRDELGELSTLINELLARLEASFDQQRRFVADASHELRTPVSIISAEADIALNRRRTEAEYRDALRVVQDASTRLASIVNDLFLLARADAGRQPVRTEHLYLDEVVTDAARAIRTLATNRGVQIVVEPLPEAPARGDAELLGRLLLNLLDNAVKYSAKGSQVFVSLREDEEWYDLRVADCGPGIPIEAQPLIFERFYRVDSARSRADTSRTSGAGLGLAIARWIAESHGGRLELARSTSKGSEFSVRLPRVQSESKVLTVVS
jgi:heavy metal sensor kinase